MLELMNNSTELNFVKKLIDEKMQSTIMHGKFKSLHEGIAIIREEYLELEKEIFKRIPDRTEVEKECIQLANCCFKLYEFLNPKVFSSTDHELKIQLDKRNKSNE